MYTSKHGYYLVGNQYFNNKTLALIEQKKTGESLKWFFNEDAYSRYDWTTPVEADLFDLYKCRAKQLREKYDYLTLHYSGGADSSTILWAFIESETFLDEIVMQLPEPTRQTFNEKDTSNKNYYSELEYSAVPFLNKHRNKLNPNTLIRYQDFSKPALELLRKDNWFESTPLCHNITISGIARQRTHNTEQHILNLCDTGKRTAQILGIDKPMVYYDGKNYYSYFADTNAYHYVSPVDFNETEISNGLYTTEFFYWTPDLPEIVIKQAQEIKKDCEKNPWSRFMATQTGKRHISEFRSVLHPVIYPKEVEVFFQTEKPSSSIMRSMDSWFWSISDITEKKNYLETIGYLKNNINSNMALHGDIKNGFKGHITRMYKL